MSEIDVEVDKIGTVDDEWRDVEIHIFTDRRLDNGAVEGMSVKVKTLEKLIPKMEEALKEAKEFLEG